MELNSAAASGGGIYLDARTCAAAVAGASDLIGTSNGRRLEADKRSCSSKSGRALEEGITRYSGDERHRAESKRTTDYLFNPTTPGHNKLRWYLHERKVLALINKTVVTASDGSLSTGENTTQTGTLQSAAIGDGTVRADISNAHDSDGDRRDHIDQRNTPITSAVPSTGQRQRRDYAK